MIIYKQPLRSSAIEDDPDTAKALPKDSVLKLLSEDFWEKVEAPHELLSPIAMAIKKVEGNNPMMSLSVQYFNKIALDFENITLKRPVLEGESQAFDEILKKRRKFCINNMHWLPICSTSNIWEKILIQRNM